MWLGVWLGVCAGWRGEVCGWGGEVGCVAGCVVGCEVGCVAGCVAGCVYWVEGFGGERSASAAAEGVRGRGWCPRPRMPSAAAWKSSFPG